MVHQIISLHECLVDVFFVFEAALNLETHQLISGAQFMDFIQVGLDGLQVGEAVTTTQLQNHLQRGRDGTQVTQRSMKRQEKAVGKS